MHSLLTSSSLLHFFCMHICYLCGTLYEASVLSLPKVLGAESCYGPNANPIQQTGREAILWLAVHHQQKGALELMAQEFAPAGTGMGQSQVTMLVHGVALLVGLKFSNFRIFLIL